MNYMEALKAFHEKHGAYIGQEPEIPPAEVVALRKRLIDEEVNRELLVAMEANDLVEIADALADSLYVIFGTALAYGIPMDRVFAEVQRSNMTKDAVKTPQGDKVQKGPNFDPPKIAAMLGLPQLQLAMDEHHSVNRSLRDV